METGKRLTRIPRLILATAFVAAALFVGNAITTVHATLEGQVTYNVSQSPAAGSVLQVGQTVSFTIDITAAPGPFLNSVSFQLKKPGGMTFLGYGQQAGNVVSGCTNNTPSSAYVSCTIGSGTPAPGALAGPSANEIVLNFEVTAAAAGREYSDAEIQGLFSDAGTGFRTNADAPDPTDGTDDTLQPSVGNLTVANILGSPANITIATAATPTAVFEGAVTNVVVTLTHALPAAVGPTLQPITVEVTNGDVQASSIACPGGGTSALTGSGATCSGGTIGSGSTMTFEVRARDTSNGDDIAIVVSAPSLGLTALEAAAAPTGTANASIAVDEVGLETVTLPSPFTAAAPPWTVGQAITVCTATVGSDVTSDKAAGSGQTAGVTGTSTLSPVTPLAAADFVVTNLSGPVAATYLDSSAENCGDGQSGVQFTPAATGSYQVTARYNGDTSSPLILGATRGTNQLTIAVQTNNPVPSVSSLSPTTKQAGSGAFELTVTGTGFVPGSVVRWNDADRTTEYVSATELRIQVPGIDIASAGTATVKVFNPAPAGGISPTPRTFTISPANNPVPILSSLTPSSVDAGSPGFALVLNGSNFVDGATVLWDGVSRTATFLSSTQLGLSLLASDLASADSVFVQVVNPPPGTTLTSAPLTFTIKAVAPGTPALTSISPTTAVAGGAAFTLTANGSGFTNQSKVRWNGTDLTTTFVSATQLTAQVPASNIASAGSASVTIATGGGTPSSAITFTITNAVPTITSLTPASIEAGSAAFKLTVKGTNFTANSVVRWDGADRTTTFVSATELTADITAADIADEGTAGITVLTPGAAASNEKTFTIGEPTITESDKLAVVEHEGAVARSRLTFAATAGDLAPTSVNFVIKRASDDKYWNGATGEWQDEAFENPATADSGTWKYAVTGPARRLFVNTAVEVSLSALKGTKQYASAESVALVIR